jgi:hypothetical protein
MKFNENPSSESRVVRCAAGRTERHDETNSSFRKFAKAPKTVYLHFSQYTVYNTLSAYSSGMKHVGSRHPGVRAYVSKRLRLLE